MKNRLSDFWGRFRKDAHECGWKGEERAAKVHLKTFSLKDEYDVNEVLDFMRLGTAMAVITIKKPAIAFGALKQVKALCNETGGSVIGLSGNCFLAIPPSVEFISRGSSEKERLVESYARREDIVQEKSGVYPKRDGEEEWEDIDWKCDADDIVERSLMNRKPAAVVFEDAPEKNLAEGEEPEEVKIDDVTPK